MKLRVETLLVTYLTKLQFSYPANSNFECVHLSVEVKTGIARQREMTIDHLCTMGQLIDIAAASSRETFSIAGDVEAIATQDYKQLIAGGFAIRFCNDGTWFTADVPGIK